MRSTGTNLQLNLSAVRLLLSITEHSGRFELKRVLVALSKEGGCQNTSSLTVFKINAKGDSTVTELGNKIPQLATLNLAS